MHDLEERIISKKNIHLSYNSYPETSKVAEEDLGALAIRLLVCSIYLIIYKKQFDQLQVHTDKVYMDIVQSIDKFESYKIENNDIYNHLFKGGLERPFGQKLIPLSVGEAVKINNITYPAWRELFISYAACDMVLNGISPTFVVAANWTYIEGADVSMFDNKVIRDKYKQNDEVIHVIENLKAIYKFSEDINDISESRQKIFNTLSNLSSNKLLSNLALARIDEFANVTVGTIARTVRNAKVIPPQYKKFITEVEYFDKIIFDLMYGSHVLHKKSEPSTLIYI